MIGSDITKYYLPSRNINKHDLVLTNDTSCYNLGITWVRGDEVETALSPFLKMWVAG